jgi:hypothetical protein
MAISDYVKQSFKGTNATSTQKRLGAGLWPDALVAAFRSGAVWHQRASETPQTDAPLLLGNIEWPAAAVSRYHYF